MIGLFKSKKEKKREEAFKNIRLMLTTIQLFEHNRDLLDTAESVQVLKMLQKTFNTALGEYTMTYGDPNLEF